MLLPRLNQSAARTLRRVILPTLVLRSAAFSTSITASGSMSTLPSEHSAIVARNQTLQLVKEPIPQARKYELLLKVHYSAVNRADTLQRRGLYPVPAGCTEVLGLEAAGEVVAHGPDADAAKYPIGSRVMALLSGGGNAEYVNVHEAHVMPIPDGVDYKTAAAIPETWLTAYQLLTVVGGAKRGDVVLMHAAASGVGTAAVQIASKVLGLHVVAVAGEDRKLEAVKALGAHASINYKTLNGEFAKPAREAAASVGRDGVDLVLDPVGGSFWRQNAEALGTDGRWVLYGTMGGGSVDGGLFAQLLRKRITLTATTLRSRSVEYKGELVASFARDVLPALAAACRTGLTGSHTGSASDADAEGVCLQPIVDSVYSLSEAQQAHNRMETNANIGKILLQVTSG